MVNTDLRLAVRTLRQSPTFTFTAVLSLALGIGASTSVYALTFALFFAPPPGVDQPESLVRICRLANGRPEGHELSYAEYVYYRDHATVFTELASDGNVKMLTDTEDGYQLLTAVVSPSYFTVLGLRPHAGRFFLPGEDTAAGHDQVVVLSHGFWQRRFAGDSRSIGGRLTLAGTSYAIVGVAPPNFEGSSAGWAPDVFVPTRAVFSEADLANVKNGQLDLIGRLEPGRTLAEAQAEMTVLARRLEQADPETNRGASLLVSKLRGLDPEARSSQARLPTLLVTTVACLLMIACVNLAGLLQTRHAARGKEIAIRLALGAGRSRVVRQLLTESLLLSAFGGAAGLVVAWWGKTLLERAYAREMFDGARHFYPLTLDARAFLLTLLTAAATGVVFGLVPALQASRPVLVPALKEDASSAAALAPAGRLSRRAGRAVARAPHRRRPRDAERAHRLAESRLRRRARRVLQHRARTRGLSRREGDALRRRSASPARVAPVRGVDIVLMGPAAVLVFNSRHLPPGAEPGPTRGHVESAGELGFRPFLRHAAYSDDPRAWNRAARHRPGSASCRSSTKRWPVASGRSRIRSGVR